MKDFTLEDLAAFNGKNGQPAYVAFRGTVYDVSDSPMWEEGDHEAMHDAGHDLTAEHADAPHDEYIVDFPVVGKLV
ncbi:MAG: cytochrome b5 domain-containing protein [Coriobacteriia bacterium]|jgi:predicted heme/steroid binding protein|nr:cytochrome b5 domain-containing protein [Coriobacteriia bacterium]